MRGGVLCLAALCACGRVGFGPVVGDDTPGGSGPFSIIVPEFTTPSSTFTPVPGTGIDLPPAPGRSWLLAFSSALGSTSTAEIAAEIRYVIDGTEQGIGGTQVGSVGKDGPWQHFDVIPGSDVPIHVEVELRDAAGGTARVTQLHEIALLLPTAADALFQAQDAITSITGQSLAPVVTFTLTPATPGTYLVLGLANASDAPGHSDVYVDWKSPSGTHLEDIQHPRAPWQADLAMWTEMMTGPTPITFSSHAGNGTSQVRYIRVLAVRIDAFPAATVDVENRPLEAATATGLTASSVVPSAGATSYLYIASTMLGERCGTGVFAERTIDFLAGATVTRFDHVTDNCSYELTYGAFALLPAAPALLETRVSSGNGQVVTARESAIALLGLP